MRWSVLMLCVPTTTARGARTLIWLSDIDIASVVKRC